MSSSEGTGDRTSHSISTELFDRILSTAAITPADRRFHAVADRVLLHAVKHLASPGIGVELLVLQCFPSINATDVTVTSLYATLAAGTHPWDDYVRFPFQFHGAESLAGYAARQVHPVVSQDVQKNPERMPLRRAEYAKSLAVYPILQMRRVAGCLQVSSTQVHFFSSDRLEAIRCYANLLPLAFSSYDFYEPRQLTLNLMPDLDVQRRHFAMLETKTRAILRKGRREQIDMPQAERLALREIEQALRDLVVGRINFHFFGTISFR